MLKSNELMPTTSSNDSLSIIPEQIPCENDISMEISTIVSSEQKLTSNKCKNEEIDVNQLPSSSTEENLNIADSAAKTGMEQQHIVNDVDTMEKSKASLIVECNERKQQIKEKHIENKNGKDDDDEDDENEEFFDCIVDSSSLIDKCDSATNGNTVEINVNAGVSIEATANENEMSSKQAQINGNENDCSVNTENNLSMSIDKNAESQCDNHESVNKDVTQVTKTENCSNINDAIKNIEQLDSEIKELTKPECKNNESSTENLSGVCDSSDILAENKNQSIVVGAISVNADACETKNENDKILLENDKNVDSNKMDIDEELCKEEVDVKPIEKEEKEKSYENKEHEHEHEHDQCKKNDTKLDNENVQVEESIEKKCIVDNCEKTQINSENEMKNGANVVDCIVDRNDSSESTNGNNIKHNKCDYDDTVESVSSPEIAPIGFKDKFKKSLEIMEKSKQEMNLNVMNTSENNKMYQQTQFDVKAKTHDEPISAIQMNTSVSEQIPSVVQTISIDNELDCSKLNKKWNEAKLNRACELSEKSETTTNYERMKNSERNSETKETFNMPHNLNSSIEHSMSENSASSTDKTIMGHEHDKNSKIKTPFVNATRTIIVSPQNDGKFDFDTNKFNTSNTINQSNLKATKSVSLYIDNPDFSKSMRPSSIRDLSELKMKPPDFSRISSRSSELQVPNPDFTKAYDKLNDITQRHSPVPREVNPSNFAEISKKYNYISDLQLKNPRQAAAMSNVCRKKLFYYFH